MTVPSTQRRAGPFSGNGTTTSFPFTFKVFAAEDVEVVKTGTNALESTLVLNSDYSVTMNIDQDASPGGTVTYPITGSPLAAGEKLTLVGNLDYEQTTNLTQGGSFSPTVIEDTFDRTVIQIQQLEEEITRALRMSVSTTASGELPAAEAGKLIGWDQLGGGFANYDAGALFSGAVYADWKYDVFTGNGSTVAYVLQQSPGNIANMSVSVGGVTQIPMADYTLSGSTVTFTSAPPNGASILLRYGQAAQQVSSTFSIERQTATASQTVFNLTSASYLPGSNNLAVYVNGLKAISGVDFTETDSDTVTFASGLTAGDELEFVCGRTLNDAVGSESVSFKAASSTLTRSVQSKLRDMVSVKDFGAVGDGIVDDAAAIQAAIDAASATGKIVFIPAGTYRLVPATVIDDEDTSYLTYAALLMRSNMHIEGERGSVLRIADNQSTDASPKSMGMFCTDAVLSKVTIRGLDMDMNGANNPISPLRPSTYRLYNQSHILVSGKPGGVVAYMDDVLIEQNTFRNNPGVCDIVCAQSNALGAALGRRWRITGNTFVNNGLDSNDHTAVFAWADDVEFSGNNVINATPFGTVGKTGGNTGYEIHGNRHRIVGNVFKNYIRGIWVSSNLTDSEARDSVIANNVFDTMFYGVDFFRTAATLGQPRNTVIVGNTFRFDGTTYSGSPTQKSAINIASEFGQRDILVSGNVAFSSDTAVGATFITVTPQTTAGQTHDNIACNNNSVRGFTYFAVIRSNATNGIGAMMFSGNTWLEPLTSPTATVPIGFFVDPVSAIKTLSISGNSFIDERGSPLAQYGVYIQAGSITDFSFIGNISKGLTVSEYSEAGAVTFGSVRGNWQDVAYTPTVSAGSAITVGNGSVSGRWSMSGDMVTANFRLDVGSTTTFPGGTLTFTAPFTAKTSGRTYMGQYRIFDTSASIFRTGVCTLDGTANTVSFAVDGATNASNSSPIPLANGDVVSAQIIFRRA